MTEQVCWKTICKCIDGGLVEKDYMNDANWELLTAGKWERWSLDDAEQWVERLEVRWTNLDKYWVKSE